MAKVKEEQSNGRFDNSIFGLRIVDILKQRGLSVKWLADRLGVSPASVYTFINGEGSVSISKLIEVARALDVEFSSLFAKTGWCGEEDDAKSMIVNGIGFDDIDIEISSAEVYALRNALGRSSAYVRAVLSGNERVSPIEYSIIAEKLKEKAWRIMPNVKVRCIEDLVAKVKSEYMKSLC